MSTNKGTLITFEGGEGPGKSTQIKLLKEYLEEKGYDVESAREPGTGEIPELIRAILKGKDIKDMNKFTELFLFEAARAQFVQDTVKPALEKGKILLCDRFRDSTTAYQGYGDGNDLEIIGYLNNIATQGIKPDLTYVLDIKAEKGLGKEIEGGRITDKGLEFHKRVNQGYREMAKQEPDRIKVIPYLEGQVEEMQNLMRFYFNEFLRIKK